MAADEPVFVMLDANVLLHFQRPDQIDWLAMLNCRSVRLIITPILLKELEKQKVTNSSRKLRDRARSLVTWMGTFIESKTPPDVRKGVAFSLVRHSPQIDYAQHRLSQTIADDELIATAIEYQSEHGCTVSVCTADMGLRLKLLAHELQSIKLPDELMLPNEPDEVEKENSKLKSELARYVNRAPLLQFSFLDGSVRVALPSIMAAVDAEQEEPLPPFGMAVYNYEEYPSDFREWKSEARLSTAFRVRLDNAGTAVATDVGIHIEFPDFVRAIHLRRKPEMRTIMTPPYFDLEEIGVSEEAPTYSEDGKKVTFELASLVHHRRFESDEIFLRFLNVNEIRSFSASFHITCVEAIKPLRGALHFTVDEWAASS